MIEQIYEIYELRLLDMPETQRQKNIKKALFIVISIIFPIIEFITNIIQIFYFINGSKYFDGIRAIFIGLTLGSLICTWGMVSVCYLRFLCIKFLLFFKFNFIVFILIYLYGENRTNNNFNYYLVFNIIGYGLFYTLIIIYKVFPKGII